MVQTAQNYISQKPLREVLVVEVVLMFFSKFCVGFPETVCILFPMWYVSGFSDSIYYILEAGGVIWSQMVVEKFCIF